LLKLTNVKTLERISTLNHYIKFLSILVITKKNKRKSGIEV